MRSRKIRRPAAPFDFEQTLHTLLLVEDGGASPDEQREGFRPRQLPQQDTGDFDDAVFRLWVEGDYL